MPRLRKIGAAVFEEGEKTGKFCDSDAWPRLRGILSKKLDENHGDCWRASRICR